MDHQKSAGFLRFQREMEGPLAQLNAGEIDQAEYVQNLKAVIRATAPEMRDEELRAIMDSTLQMMQGASEALASLGHPVPGNDPHKPN